MNISFQYDKKLIIYKNYLQPLGFFPIQFRSICDCTRNCKNQRSLTAHFIYSNIFSFFLRSVACAYASTQAFCEIILYFHCFPLYIIFSFLFLAVAFLLQLNINRCAHFFSNTVKLLILLPEFCSFQLKTIFIMESTSCP